MAENTHLKIEMMEILQTVMDVVINALLVLNTFVLEGHFPVQIYVLNVLMELLPMTRIRNESSSVEMVLNIQLKNEKMKTPMIQMGEVMIVKLKQISHVLEELKHLLIFEITELSMECLQIAIEAIEKSSVEMGRNILMKSEIIR